MKKRLKITCVHQGFELYGSDRSFIISVEGLRRGFPEADITVLIPEHGPITPYLEALGCHIKTADLWVLRKKDFLKRITIGLPSLVAGIAAAIRQIRASDLAYINTSVILDYYIAARFAGKTKVIGHIREIPTGITMAVFKKLIRFSKATLIYNSNATRMAFALDKSQPTRVLLNAVEPAKQLRLPTYDGGRHLNVLLIGRLNSWKGQDLLIEALSLLSSEDLLRMQVRIVGSAFRGTEYAEKLSALVEQAGLDQVVTLMPFTEHPEELQNWADIIVVPSKKPEPFGLVAIEAFARARPVIAAGHGGLVEIVTPGSDGWLFEPNNAADLAQRFKEALENPAIVRSFGTNALATFERRFAVQAYQAALRDFVAEIIA